MRQAEKSGRTVEHSWDRGCCVGIEECSASRNLRRRCRAIFAATDRASTPAGVSTAVDAELAVVPASHGLFSQDFAMLRTILLALTFAATITVVTGCTREAPDEAQAPSEPGATSRTMDDDEASEPRAEETGAASEKPDSAAARQVESLNDLAQTLDLEPRGAELQDALPPVPENATLRSGLFSGDRGTVGLVYVQYPRDGYARPHVEDIAERGKRGQAVAAAYHAADVVEVRAADASTARAMAARIAEHLRWASVPVNE